jgi:hypothetical protein
MHVASIFNLKMKAALTPEMLASYHNPEDLDLSPLYLPTLLKEGTKYTRLGRCIK